jgi:hypothetical protein
LKLAVLDPGWRGYDPAFVHAYAACTGGSVFTALEKVPEGPALVVLRKNNLRRAVDAIGRLRARGSKVLITPGACSTHGLAEMLGDTTRWELFRAACAASDGVVSPVARLVPFFENAGAPRVESIPVPVDLGSAGPPKPPAELRGIFVGTREFRIPARRHLEAVVLADSLSRRLQVPLAVLNSEGRDGGMVLKDFQRRNPLFFIIEAPLTRPDFLDVLRLHRIVWQLDSSSGFGRVAADALACGIPTVGGDGATETLAFPAHCGPRNPQDLLDSAARLLAGDAFWQGVMESAAEACRRSLSPAAVCGKIMQALA